MGADWLGPELSTQNYSVRKNKLYLQSPLSTIIFTKIIQISPKLAEVVPGLGDREDLIGRWRSLMNADDW